MVIQCDRFVFEPKFKNLDNIAPPLERITKQLNVDLSVFIPRAMYDGVIMNLEKTLVVNRAFLASLEDMA